MRLEYNDVNNVFHDLVFSPDFFDTDKDPHTYYAKTDSRKNVEVTHLGAEEVIDLNIPWIKEADLPAYQDFLSAMEDCQEISFFDPDGDLPEHTFPMTAIRTESEIPTLKRIEPTCKEWKLSARLLIRG